MGRITDAWRALTGKAQTSPRLFHSANITARDRFVTRRSINPTVAQLLEAWGGVVRTCARRNGEMAAAQPLKLYRPARGTDKAKRVGAKGVVYGSRFTARKLRPHEVRRVRGTKAARYAAAAGEVEEVLEHPLLDLLDNPNPDDGMGAHFWQRWYEHGRPLGNAYLHPVVHSDGSPIYLFLMEPHRVTVIPDDSGERMVSGYWYGRDGGAVQRFEPDEVLHYKAGGRTDDPFYGAGWIEEVWDVQRLWDATTEYMHRMMGNQGTPTAHFKLPEDISPDEFRAASDRIYETFSGLENTGKPFVSTSDDVTVLAHTPKDMEYLEGRASIEQQIMAAAGIPEAVMRMNDANLASAREAHPQYMLNTIGPMVASRCEFLNENLLPMYGVEPGEMWLDYNELVAEDAQIQSTIRTQEVNAGIRTINEARSESGLEPVEGGDDLRVNGQSLEALDTAPADPFAGLIPRTAEVAEKCVCGQHGEGETVSASKMWEEYVHCA